MMTQAHIEDRLSKARLCLAVALTDQDRDTWRDAIEGWEEVIALRRERGLWNDVEEVPVTPIPYDEMRAILGLPDPPFDKGGFPHATWASGKAPDYIYQLSHPITEVEKHAIAEGFRRLGFAIHEWQLRFLEHMVEISKAARSVAQTLESLTPADQRPHPLHPAIPRPRHTSPMWANDPTRTRRRRNR